MLSTTNGREKRSKRKLIMMSKLSLEELTNASRAIVSLLSKCEKALEKFSPGTSQYTLLKNRIHALRIATKLIDKAITESIEKG